MRVLVVGSGGREHALCWAIATSPLLTRLFCAPGNPGTAAVAENVAIAAMDIAGLVAFCTAALIDLVVPGPEGPLVAGLADALAAAGIRCCGPSAAAARLEGSKSFTKELADLAGVPTARWERFDDADLARAFVRRRGAPIVIKADGLAAGKGVVVAATVVEADAAITDMMTAHSLGEAGASVVIEECLHGPELSLFALCDGTAALPLGAARDHKRAFDGDTGPNTGGMGAFSPAGEPGLIEAGMAGFIRPVLAELARRGTPFRGILFAGLMLTPDGPRLIEFNVRFGDPECQVLLMRLHSDLLTALAAACYGTLDRLTLRWHDDAAIAVVMAARGYPGAYGGGDPIGGLDRAAQEPGVQIFHAGTTRVEGTLRSNGGRVLTVCARAPDTAAARRLAYRAIDAIEWPQGFCRRDIGAPDLGRPGPS